MKKLLLSAVALASLSGCTVGSNPQITAVMNDLTTIANTSVNDLNSMISVANAATPPDVDGAACASAALVVGANIQKVIAATPTGATVGVFTAAEIASLYQPGSAQFNLAVTTIETGCVAKVHDMLQAQASTVGMPAALIAALGIAGLPIGA